ncbi:hypothetical protein [Shewanella sp. S23-S33]|jgi:hypothetical protein|uniref:hypothetical protein n=1 Tax=Shewanella TaxID=22 RepID=UPI00372CE9EB
MPTCFITRASELKGRIIAYGGGSGIFVFSADVAAKAEQAAELAQQLPASTFLPSVISLGGLLVVVCRFVFDVFKYFDQRRQQRKGADDEA